MPTSDKRERVREYFDQTGQDSKTHQSMADECDINTILGRFRTTGFVEHQNLNRAVYEDFATTADYQESMFQIAAAKTQFERLPARVRELCGNDPAKLIDIVADPRNDDELRRLGLKNPIAEKALAAPEEPAGNEEPESLVQGGE